eukprot:SAG31_NODE_156_length_22055_cov_105.227728_4_plen_98_part_00
MVKANLTVQPADDPRLPRPPMTSIVQADVSSGTDGGSDVGDVGSGVSSPSARGRPFNGSPDATEVIGSTHRGTVALPIVFCASCGSTSGDNRAHVSI